MKYAIKETFNHFIQVLTNIFNINHTGSTMLREKDALIMADKLVTEALINQGNYKIDKIDLSLKLTGNPASGNGFGFYSEASLTAFLRDINTLAKDRYGVQLNLGFDDAKQVIVGTANDLVDLIKKNLQNTS